MGKSQFGSLRRIERPSLPREVRHTAVLAVVSVLCLSLHAGMIPPSAAQWPGLAASNSPFGDTDSAQEQKRLRVLNIERQKSMTMDAEKLLKLAHQLNDEVAKDNPESLSPAQLRSMAEIEKLAHNVKEKMSYAFMGGPVLREPPRPPGVIR